MANSIIDFTGPLHMAFQAALLGPRAANQESLADYREGQLALEDRKIGIEETKAGADKLRSLTDYQKYQDTATGKTELASIYGDLYEGKPVEPRRLAKARVLETTLGVKKAEEGPNIMDEAKNVALDQQAFDVTARAEVGKTVLAPLDAVLPVTQDFLKLQEDGQKDLNAKGYDVQSAIWRTLKDEGKTVEAEKALATLRKTEQTFAKERGNSQEFKQKASATMAGLQRASQGLTQMMDRNEQELDALVKVQEQGKLSQLYPGLTPQQAEKKAALTVGAMREQRDVLQGMKTLTEMQSAYVKDVRTLDPDQRAERMGQIQAATKALEKKRTALKANLDGLQQERYSIQQERFQLMANGKGDADLRGVIQAMHVAGIDPQSAEGQQTLRDFVAKKTTHQPASKTDLNLSLGKGLTEEASKIVGESRNAAQGAIDTTLAANRIEQAIETNAINLGPTATIRNKIDQVSQMIGVGGKDTEQRLVNTRNTIRSLAQFTIGARKALKGQGQVSDFEGKLLMKAESGEIDDMTMPELKAFIGVTKRMAERQYLAHQGLLKNLKSSKDEQIRGLVPLFEVGELPKSQGSSFVEIRTTKDGRKIGKKADGSFEEIK